ncbi:hypothetical protein A4R43_14500 [Amycolatopsis albispora]|uniref:Uncharacterized protein n=1 Tax=Amycolatopsis albispora TaxID=1804986 RepID=A0A344L6C3_9PSEU|nr:hypothetical protein A4R43_14500 [Amycolatopsis albispora]
MHQLSYVTKPRYLSNLLDFYAQWALTRYAGFFDHRKNKPGTPELVVSEAGRRIVGNQRRVTSEEMGIAFGAVLAIRWFQQAVTTRLPISIVDIDAALDDRYVFAGGAKHAVRKVNTNRPDYLLVGQHPSARRGYVLRTLECKGTKTRGNAVKQMAKALTQLGGISVGGEVPTGLATSVIAADRLRYLALDPEGEDERSHVVDAGTIADVRGFRLTDEREWSPAALAAASVRASWATLADFGGNRQAFETWAPTVMSERLDRQPRARNEFETPYGRARGTSTTFTVAGQLLTVRYAINSAVDRALEEGSPEAIIDTQAEFADGLPHEPVQRRGTGEAYSVSPDGSIFSLSLD